jgi:hypothetical protein
MPGARRPSPQSAEAPQQVMTPAGALVSEETVLPGAPVDPDERLPAGFARMTVQRSRDHLGRETFHLSGQTGDGTEPFTGTSDQLPAPFIRLSNVQAQGAAPGDIYRAVLDWSRRQTDLTGWINTLRARSGDRLRLIIWDDTDFDIPWELLWLDADDERGLRGGHLGALVTVARWTNIRELGTPRFGQIMECSGHVVGYFQPEMERDIVAFQPFEHRRHLELVPLLRELSHEELRAGLVYFGCHGAFGGGVAELLLGVADWMEINEVDMAGLRHHATMVCLNACHSGRAVLNIDQGEDALRGFAELFLRKGARGCIASSGKVGDDEAHQVITQIVGDVAAAPDKPVAESLRDFRARAAAELPDPLPWVRMENGRIDLEGQRKVRAFLYSFMFLYFGPPLTTLRLRPGDGGAP